MTMSEQAPAVLALGSVPLAVLEERVDAWIARRLAS
jgi:uncharacterized protein (DUF885 family)